MGADCGGRGRSHGARGEAGAVVKRCWGLGPGGSGMETVGSGQILTQLKAGPPGFADRADGLDALVAQPSVL